MATTLITIPFQVLRLVLPQDGEVLGFTLKENRWPDNTAKGPFEQHERVELAFGWILRARHEDRKHERANPPGILDRGGYIEYQAGWRAHKAVPAFNDYFDGTCSGHLRFRHEGGAVTAIVSNFKIDWNGGIVEVIAKLLVNIIEQQVQSRLNDVLSRKFRADLDGLLAKYPPLARLRSRARLTFEGTSLAIEVETD
jgi:hypothetical protein